jgi:uncharacterized membrane protein YesL
MGEWDPHLVNPEEEALYRERQKAEQSFWHAMLDEARMLAEQDRAYAIVAKWKKVKKRAFTDYVISFLSFLDTGAAILLGHHDSSTIPQDFIQGIATALIAVAYYVHGDTTVRKFRKKTGI